MHGLCTILLSVELFQLIHVHQTRAKTVAPATPKIPGDTSVSALTVTEDHAAPVNLVYIVEVCLDVSAKFAIINKLKPLQQKTVFLPFQM